MTVLPVYVLKVVVYDDGDSYNVMANEEMPNGRVPLRVLQCVAESMVERCVEAVQEVEMN